MSRPDVFGFSHFVSLKPSVMKSAAKIIGFIGLIGAFASAAFCAEAGAPLRFSNTEQRLQLILKNSPENLRLEIARISPDSIFDPPVTADSFEPSAAVFLRLGVEDFRQTISESIQALATAEWKPNSELSGLSKLRIRFIGPWGRVFAELYLDERRSAILYEGTWYGVDPKIFKVFVSNITQCAVEALMKSSGRFDGPNLGR